MRIIKITKTTAEAERRIAAIMYCMEQGARIVDDEGKELKAPHAPFPEIKMNSKTDQGHAVKISYKPTVGIIFYSAGPGFSPRALAERLREAMRAYGDAHLLTHKPVAVTPCATLRHRPHVIAGTEVIGPRLPYKKRDEAEIGIARTILFTPIDYCDHPYHISLRSAFTWIIMNGAAAIDLQCLSMPEFNASVASVFYDAAGIISLDDNAEVPRVEPSDVVLPGLPDEIKNALAEPDRPDPYIPQEAILIQRNTGAMIIVGDNATLTVRRPPQMPQTEEKWGASKNVHVDLKNMSCISCKAPLWGEVVLIKAPKEPQRTTDVDGWLPNLYLNPGADILGGRAVAICRFCYRILPACVPAHLRSSLVRSRIYRTQDVALKGTHLEHMIPLVTAGRATPVPDVMGAFSVGEKFVIAPPAKRFMEIGCPILMGTKLPVIRYPRLAETM